ncbi:hypothetical protein BC936DRAFT_141942 [Jimgerdemannia flammicorona]|uniref:Ferritin/DPS domain-containing protein n=1 Tax=Jimgerdemannia flammicorona TaxID=994334 RepID=A0A433A1D4_9FUNG|nr:hypothetical protein BC936DRAFT_141942 [Jimgerdemannia flammicorona]
MSLAKQNYSNASEEAVNQQINTELQASLVYLSMAAWAGSVNVALPGAYMQRMWCGRARALSNSCRGRVTERETRAFETNFLLGEVLPRELRGGGVSFGCLVVRERAHAQLLINYQNMRGGRVVLRALQAPELDWGSAKNAVESSLQLEKGMCLVVYHQIGFTLNQTPFPQPMPKIHPSSTTDVNKSLLNLHKIAEESNDPQLCDYIESNFLEEQVKSIKALASMCTQLNRVGDGLGVYLWDQQLRNSDTGVETGDITA